MKRVITALCCVLLSASWLYADTYTTRNDFANGENPDETKEVLKVVNQLFDGMRKGDSAMVSAVFDRSVRMASIEIRNGIPSFREGSLQRFLNAVGTPHDKVWDERIWDPVVKIDDNMSTVWVHYAFYLDDQFSHCGVNAFQLFKSVSGWKIVNITDTRRKDRCEEP